MTLTHKYIRPRYGLHPFTNSLLSSRKLGGKTCSKMSGLKVSCTPLTKLCRTHWPILNTRTWQLGLATLGVQTGKFSSGVGTSEHGRTGVREFYYWNAADSMTSPSQLASAHFHTARFCEHVQICSFVSTDIYKMRLLCSLQLNIPWKKKNNNNKTQHWLLSFFPF